MTRPDAAVPASLNPEAISKITVTPDQMRPLNQSLAGVRMKKERIHETSLKRPLDSEDGLDNEQPNLPHKRRMKTIGRGMTEQHTVSTSRSFRLLHRICRHVDLLAAIVQRLPLPDIINLYSISKAFHLVFNWNYTTMILAAMRTWAPDADRIFPWRFYKNLCIKDPSHRRLASWMATDKTSAAREDLRDVPSLRWLQMVVWRWCVTKDMLIQLAVHSLRCPSGTHAALQRMWFLLDLPVNALRIAVVQSRTYLTDTDLLRVTAFFLKVDMFFTESNGRVFPDEQLEPNRWMFPRAWVDKHVVGCSFRELLLNERHLSSLWRAIRGWTLEPGEGSIPIDYMDVLRLWIRHEYQLPTHASDKAKRQSIFGVPWWQVGRCSYERINTLKDSPIGDNLGESTRYTPRTSRVTSQPFYPHQRRLVVPTPPGPVRLQRPDELVFKEGFRRSMMMHQQWARLMFFGFCDEMGRNYGDLTEEELLAWSHGDRPPDDRIFVGLTPSRRFRRGPRRAAE